jgi:hypothetical protein
MRKNNFLINSFVLIVSLILGYFVARWIEPAVMERLWHGDSVQWQSLGSPPGGAGKILSTGQEFNTKNVFVSANDGKTYHCCTNNALIWEETIPPPAPARWACGTMAAFPAKRLPGKIADCAEISSWEGPTNQTVFTVLEDGTVWRWHNQVFYFLPLVILFVYGPLAGLILGIALLWAVGKFRRASQPKKV